MTTTSKSRRGPTHLGGFKFERGQAVLVLTWPKAQKQTLTTAPAVVDNAGDYFITVQTAGGLQRVRPTLLHHRGYCTHCELAAHLEGDRLVCPRCEGQALDDVPERLLPEWDWQNSYIAGLFRTMLRHGCTQKEAHGILRAERRARWDVMLERTGLMESYKRFDRFWHCWGSYQIEQRMHSAIARDDVDGFLEGVEQLKRQALYNAAGDILVALAEQQVVGDALHGQIAAAAAADSEPDGADDLTRWLDGQFRKAA